MKLLTRYNRANIITAIIILLASSITYYFIIRLILLQQIDKDLKVEEQEIQEYVQENNVLPGASAYKGQEIKFEIAGSENIKREIKSSTITNADEGEDEPVRMLTFPVKVNGVLHKATVIKSQVEAEDLLKLIVLVTAGIFLLLLIVVSFINRFLLGKLWQPFYHTLHQLRSFNIKNSKALELPATNLEEFHELNTSVAEMTKRVSNEFESLKAFTDNASHEMQTPLAIINSKLDLLLQTSNEKQAEQLQAIYNATGRLTRLNQTLLLLTKIDNNQYSNQQKVNLKKLVEQKLQQFDELIKARNLHADAQLDETFVNINIELADILLNNLFSNAIKHNYNGGYIHCSLSQSRLSISNSGYALTFNKEDMFKRFQKSNHSDGTGLGLAVVKQICERSNLSIDYSYTNNEYVFNITFAADSGIKAV